MRKRQLIEGALVMVAMIAFAACFLGATMLEADNAKGWAFEAIALIITVPVVILLNREGKE